MRYGWALDDTYSRKCSHCGADVAHEFMFCPQCGVAAEEWGELLAAVRSNNIIAVRDEALDLAAICLRLANECQEAHEHDMATPFARRSWK